MSRGLRRGVLLFFCIAYFVSFAQEKEYSFYQREYPAWFSNAKLGIMIHYGLYSIPSYSGREQYAEWFYKGLISADTLRQNFLANVYGKDFRYFDFMKMFRSEMFSAQEWITLFKNSGAKYIVFTTKNHDGFCLYPSKFTTLNSMNTPSHRDFVGELASECRRQNIRLGLYYSLMEWTNPLFRWTIDSTGLDKYVTEYMIPQFKEIIDMYHPSLIFTDGDWDFDYKGLHSEELIEYFYNAVGKDAIINNRLGRGIDYGFLTPEYSAGIKEYIRPWAECRSIARSFGLNRISPLEDYMTSEELIKHFVILLSGGGGLMLNVSPAADGHIPLLQRERLMDLGKWIKTNSKAVYGTRAAEVGNVYRQDTLYRTDKEINFDWVRNSPEKGVSEDGFKVFWQGEVEVKEDGEYTFYLNADDNAEIIIRQGDGNNRIVAQGRADKDKDLQIDVDLQNNKLYNINVHYEEKDIDAHCRLYWQSKDMKRRPVESVGGWRGQITWESATRCFTRDDSNLYCIMFQRPDNTIEIPTTYRPRERESIYLLGYDKPLHWTYNKGRLIIHLPLQYVKEMDCKYAWTIELKNYYIQNNHGLK